MWKDVKEYEGLYQVNEKGELKSLERYVLCKGNKKIVREKIKKPKILPNGYVGYNVSKNGKSQLKYAHRLVAESFLENPKLFKYVNHKDGNKQNNHVSNLEWCTNVENMKHAVDNELLGQMKRIKVYHRYKGYIDTYKSITETSLKYKEFGIHHHKIVDSCNKNELLGDFLFQWKNNDNPYKNNGELNYTKHLYRYCRVIQTDLNNNYLKTHKNIREAFYSIYPKDKKNNGQVGRVCLENHYMEGFLWYFEEDYYYLKEQNKLHNYKPQAMKVAQYTLDDEYIQTFNTIAEAERNFSRNGKSTHCIGHVLNSNMRNITAYGFKWKLVL